MALFNGWPWAQFQEQNLDWFIKKLKEFEGRVDEMEEWIRSLQETVHADVAEILDTWLADGTIDQIVANAVKYKTWMFDSINSIPADVTLEVGDTVTTGSAVYMVANSGIPAGNYYLYPVSYTRAQDLGLAADGVTNDRAQFIILLNVLPVIDLHGATVLLNGSTLTMQSNRKIMNGCIRWGNSSNTLFSADGVSNVVFDTIEFDCTDSAALGKKISLVNTNNLTIQNCYMHDWFGTFARLNGAANLMIRDIRAENSSGDTGDVGALFYLLGGHNLTYENIHTFNLSDSAIYIDGSTEVRDVTITDIEGVGHTGDQNPHVIGLYGLIYNVTINNATIRDCDNGIRVAYRGTGNPHNVVISNCAIYNPKYAGVDVRADSGNRTTECMISNVSILLSQQDGIQLTNVQSIDIRDCTIIADRYGIVLTNALNCFIDGCRIENRGADHHGVAFMRMDETSANNQVSNCFLYNRDGTTPAVGFQDLRTLTSGQNVFALCRTIGSFLVNGYDIRTAIVLLPVSMGTNPKTSSLMFGTAANKPTTGLENGTTLIDSSGASNGWRYYNGAWVAR